MPATSMLARQLKEGLCYGPGPETILMLTASVRNIVVIEFRDSGQLLMRLIVSSRIWFSYGLRIAGCWRGGHRAFWIQQMIVAWAQA
jgi:hypothetical protein